MHALAELSASHFPALYQYLSTVQQHNIDHQSNNTMAQRFACIPNDSKSFFHVQITGVRHAQFSDEFDQRMCEQVGQRHVRPVQNARLSQVRDDFSHATIQLAWGSYVHKLPKGGNKKKKGTVNMYCIFTPKKITEDHVKWWLENNILRSDISHKDVTVNWMGADDGHLYASGRKIRENELGLALGISDLSINTQRNRLTALGDPGTLLETDGHKGDRKRGGYLNETNDGALWPRDRLAEDNDLPILTYDQWVRKDDATRGFRNYRDYHDHQLLINQQGNELFEFVVNDIKTYSNVDVVTREEMGNRMHLVRQAIQWAKDGGPDGAVLEATVTTRRENNRENSSSNWGNVGMYRPNLDNYPDSIPVESSIYV